MQQLDTVFKENCGENMNIFNLFKPDIEKLKAKKKVNPLIKALHYKKDCNVRKSAAEALEAIGWEPINGEGIYYLIALNDWKKLIHLGTSAVEPLLEVLQDENSSTLHRECIKALGEIRDKRAVEPLLEALQNKEISLREEAVKALGQMGDSTVVKPLISVLQNENSSTLRVQTIRALGSTKDKRAVEPLIETLQREMQKARSEANTAIIIEVAGALGKIKDNRAFEALITVIEERADYGLIEKSAWALSELGNKRAYEALNSAKNHRKLLSIKQKAINKLEQI